VKKVALAGFPLEKHEYQSLVGGVEIHITPSMGALTSMSKENLETALSSLSNFDLVVWNLGGVDPSAFIWQLKILGLFSLYSNRNYKSVFWTMDSHHMGQREKRAQKYFDHVFVAHSPYLELFPPHKTSFLPCSYSLTSLCRTSRILSAQRGRVSAPVDSSVGSIFSNYPGQRRNLSYFKTAQVLELMETKYFFGTARGGNWENQALVKTLLENSVVLNVSLADDLNMRNFEALALNRVLLTNRTPDHDIVDGYGVNIVYFRRDLADFRERAMEALELSPEDISDPFLEEHHIIQRVKRIIEVVFESSFTKNWPLGGHDDCAQDFEEIHELTSGSNVARHSNLDLLVSSGTGLFTSFGLKYSIMLGGISQVFKSTPRALTSIAKSLAVKFFGNSSLPRTLARVLRNSRRTVG
jgi:hypothetical protein